MDRLFIAMILIFILVIGVIWYFDQADNTNVQEEIPVSNEEVDQEIDIEEENNDETNEEETNGEIDEEEENSEEEEESSETEVDAEFYVEGRDDFSFSPNEIRVSQGDRVRITFKNAGNMPHDFRIENSDVGTEILNGGEEESFEFIATDRGNITFYCSVGSHRQNGMEGVIIIE